MAALCDDHDLQAHARTASDTWNLHLGRSANELSLCTKIATALRANLDCAVTMTAADIRYHFHECIVHKRTRLVAHARLTGQLTSVVAANAVRYDPVTAAELGVCPGAQRQLLELATSTQQTLAAIDDDDV